MDIKTYKPSSNADELKELLNKKYGNIGGFEYFLSEFNKAFSYCVENDNIQFLPISGFENGELQAHIALIIDKRLPKGEAFFGFLEVPNNVEVFELMWNILTREARSRGIGVLKGPINGSIWHQYRCMKDTDGSPWFKTEMLTEGYYYSFLQSEKPSAEIGYFSASREPYDIVLKLINPESLSKMESFGFSMKVAELITQSDLKTIADISRQVFKDNWGYTELNDQEFTGLYSAGEINKNLNALYLLYKGDAIIGFCSTFKENDSTLLLKTICVLSEYRGLGLGNALAYKIHEDAKKDGIKKIIYALMREGNSISNFPKDGTVTMRHYSAFEFKI
jgi:GNAT superfamily N-acetyltransferase